MFGFFNLLFWGGEVVGFFVCVWWFLVLCVCFLVCVVVVFSFLPGGILHNYTFGSDVVTCKTQQNLNALVNFLNVVALIADYSNTCGFQGLVLK